MPLRPCKALLILSLLLYCCTASSAEFNPAVLWPGSGEISKNPFALQVYEGVTLFERFQNSPIQKYRGPGKKRNAADILIEAADLDSNPIFTFGYAYSAALTEVAPRYPHIRFIAIDAGITGEVPENLAIVEFANEEGAWLMGVLAALLTQSNQIGFIGGMDVAAIRDYACGYIQGAKDIRPDVVFHLDMISDSALGFDDPRTGEALAMNQYAEGVDIIFHAAGASGMGVFAAAEKSQQLALGVDSNQNAEKPGFIASSLLKRIDVITYNLLMKAWLQQSYESRVEAGIREGAFDWVVDDNNLNYINLSVKNAMDKAKASIASGATAVRKSHESSQCMQLWRARS